MPENRLPKPKWLKKRLPTGIDTCDISALIDDQALHTVCQAAKCPNQWECFSNHTATFLIMGDRCTRNCRFCGVEQGPSRLPDPGEPGRVAAAATKMNLTYVVVTSVTRDDLEDGGASFFAETIRALRKKIKNVRVEVLVPDFQGNLQALETVVKAAPDVLNHNIETVPRLYSVARPQADYHQSLDLLKNVRSIDASMPTKSGLMLGLGETDDEIQNVLNDLVHAGCSILTLGQYLQPTKQHLPVKKYVRPEQFEQWRKKALEIGFVEVAAGPFARSSYHAKEVFQVAVSSFLMTDHTRHGQKKGSQSKP